MDSSKQTGALPYDVLVVAIGARAITWGIPGVEEVPDSDAGGRGLGWCGQAETSDPKILTCGRLTRLRFWFRRQNCFFLKTVSDAQAIRQRVLEQFERAALPHYTDDERRKMLSFVIVGGGPTGLAPRKPRSHHHR